ncbi:MAG TPA: hypothetical protein VL404_01260, partial [Candidatus Eisenbacteria bacterium]|nr:hypothetical protein [Candidatus Eisenbacteria bacterium]
MDQDLDGLLDLAERKKIDLADLPNVARLRARKEKEQAIDFDLANLEQAALVAEIEKRGGLDELTARLAVAGASKDQKAYQSACLSNVFDAARRLGIEGSKSPNLVRYSEYLAQFSALDLDDVIDELVRLEDRVYLATLENEDQKLLRAIDRYARLLSTAYRIQMSTKDFLLFRANERDFATVACLAFLNRKLAEQGYFDDLLTYRDVLEEGKKSLESFYESVSRRDLAFVDNARRILKDEKLKVAVLISGGYHTPHLKSLFKENGYSYAVLTPVVTQETNQAKYEKLLLSTLRREAPKAARNASKDGRAGSLLEKDLLRARRDGVRYEEAAHRYLDVLTPLADAARLTVEAPEVAAARQVFDDRNRSAATAVERTLPALERVPAAAETPETGGARLAVVPPTQVVGFFPGLGSRDVYRNLGSKLYDSGYPEVRRIYNEAAEALGFMRDGVPDPSRLFFSDSNPMPKDAKERGGFIGAAFVVHNLALHAYFLEEARRSGVPIEVKAYTGESFGILTAAIAAGSLSVGDGVKFAQKFTPCLLGCADEEVNQDYHVIGLKTDALSEILRDLRERFPEDVEVHKFYSQGPEEQINIYVSETVKPEFDAYMRRVYPGAEVKELKAKTKFIAHSKKMAKARNVLDEFINENNIFFLTPRVPIISNNNQGILTTNVDVALAVLGIVDEPMYSSETARLADQQDADLILEFGLGGKTRSLIEQNYVGTPYAEYTGEPSDSDAGLKTLNLVYRIREEIERLKEWSQDADLTKSQYEVLRNLFRDLPKDSPQQAYFFSVISKIVKEEMLKPERTRPAAFYRYLEIIQNTFLVHNVIGFPAVAGDALVLSAVFKKRIISKERGDDKMVDVELLVLDRTGHETLLTFPNYKYPESVTFAFSSLTIPSADLARKTARLLETQSRAWQIYEDIRLSMGLPDLTFFTNPAGEFSDADYAAATIAYQYALFKVAQLHRPSVFGQNFYYVTGSDDIGRLAALAAGDAITVEEAIRLARAMRAHPEDLDEVFGKITFKDPRIRIIDPDTGYQVKKAAAAEECARRTVSQPRTPQPLNLNFESWVVTFDPAKRSVPLGNQPTDHVVHVTGVDDVWKRHTNASLDLLDDLSLLRLTDQNGRVYKFAEGRGTTTANVYAYVHAGERVTGFGTGGSESLTVFVLKPGERQITVRKILSERLITARWDREGTGVMLPPFDKAKKQALYLQALPEPVKELFPRVYDITDRDVPIPQESPDHDKYKGKYRELIYDMSFVRGIEVSDFVRKHNPPPAVVARLYEEIFRVLRERIHSERRAPAPKTDTLEPSYLKKIEDRLKLSRETSPKVFNAQLLDSEYITINGQRYLNIRPLLARLREHPEYKAVLEPLFHSLTMGDTNTENIKITNPEPIYRAIESGRADFTAEEIGIKFLDPRAIGFNSAGAETRDDPMYDNKPWHNSLGNYDLMHGEHFTLAVTTSDQGADVRIDFDRDNPYSESYAGLDTYFKDVMTQAWGLDQPGSTFLRDDPYWTIRFAFMMGTHFTAMPPFHFSTDADGKLTDDYQHQRRPVAIYAEGIKWLNMALDMLEGRKTDLYGVPVPPLPYDTSARPRAPPQMRPTEPGSESYFGARLATETMAPELMTYMNQILSLEVESAAARAHNEGWLKGKQASLA